MFTPLRISSYLAKWRIRDLLCSSLDESNFGIITKVVHIVGREETIKHYENIKSFLLNNSPEVTKIHSPGGWFLKEIKEAGYILQKKRDENESDYFSEIATCMTNMKI